MADAFIINAARTPRGIGKPGLAGLEDGIAAGGMTPAITIARVCDVAAAAAAAA